MEGEIWNKDAQESFQIRLIQARRYGAYNAQFYRNLPQSDIDLIESREKISYQQAADIFARKGYVDGPMRGRQSFKPLQRYGFVQLKNKKIHITATGRSLLNETKDYGDIFLRAFLKWQLPNPIDGDFKAKDGYNIKPFIAALRLIHSVNELSVKHNESAKGISLDEFGIFALTLIDWQKIEDTASEIIAFRKSLQDTPANRRAVFVKGAGKNLRPAFELKHARDYTDNAIRYFRMTKYISIRGFGGNTYIDLEPSRKVEIASILNNDDASPITDFTGLGGSYGNYMASATIPDLPGESDNELTQTIQFINSEIVKDGGVAEDIPENLSLKQKQSLRNRVRAIRLKQIRRQQKSQMNQHDEAAKLIDQLRQLSSRSYRQVFDDMTPALALERLTAIALEDILNAAQDIRPNYPVDDNGIPTAHAPGGKADIECFYKEFDAICEVTLLSNSKQWIHEAEPVMRHLANFSAQRDKKTYCLFVAPKIHQDSLNIFQFSASKGYEGARQNIAPISISHFCDIAEACLQARATNKKISSARIKELLDKIADSVREMDTSAEWQRKIPSLIETWKQQNK